MRPPRDFTKQPENDIRDRSDVTQLVQWFYQAAIPDELLGPVFERVNVNWDTHIPLLVEFWSKQVLGDGDYKNNVISAHMNFYDKAPITSVHVERWLTLFNETVDELFVGPKAEHAKGRAMVIGGVLNAAISKRESAGHPDHKSLRIVP